MSQISAMTLRVAARFQRLADQAPGARSEARKLTQPINPPHGVGRTIVKENGMVLDDGNDETVSPNKRDITPKDVFTPTPDSTGVRQFAETGKDLSRALSKQVPKDKGHDAVSNLSQYLIETEGGGGAAPAGRK